MATKTDIARAAGVSRTCVSLVLNHRPNARISPQTRRKILRLAQQMGYRPADSLRAAATPSIAYVLGMQPARDFLSLWHFQLLTELHKQARGDERSVLYLANDAGTASVTQTVRSLQLAAPRGVVLDGVVPQTLVESVQKLNLPFVVAGVTPYAHDPAYVGQAHAVSIDVDDVVGRLLRWLHQRGARAIALVLNSTDFLIERLVRQAYQKQIAALQLPYNPALVQVSLGHSAAVIEHYSQLGVAFDGILFSSRALASSCAPVIAAGAAASPRRHKPVLMAAIGPPDQPAPPGIAVAGNNCQDFAATIYRLLDASLNGQAAKRTVLTLPCTFREPMYT